MIKHKSILKAAICTSVIIASAVMAYSLENTTVFKKSRKASAPKANLPGKYVPVTYYVDATNGNDGNNGTSAQTAWKTVAKVNKSKFNPSDSILFKRGETWREKLDVPSSGLSGNHITFGSYGSGNKPLFLGSVDYDDPGKWRSEGTANCWTTAKNTFNYIVGQIYYETNTGSPSGGRAGPGTTFPRFSSAAEMNTNWDFFWDGSNSRLVVYHSGGNPADQTNGLEITHVDTASDGRIDVEGKSYVTVQDLEVKYTNSHAIMVHRNCHNIIVNNCTVSYCGGIGMKARLGNGIEIMNSHDISITNCTVSQGMDEGITLECCHKDTEVYNVIISHNTVSTCGSVGIDVIILRESKSGARIHDVEISNNTAYSMGKGWIGISPNAWWTPCISLSNAYTTGVKSMYNIVVSNNDLYDSYRAGLYVKRTNDNVTITRNRIHDNDKRGIYIERGAINATLSYNLIYNNIRSGLSSAERANGSVNVYNNVFYNNGNSSYAGVRFEKDSSAVLKNNIFYSDSNAPGGATFLLSVSSPTAAITLDKNCFYGTNKNIIAWRGKNFSLAQFANYKFQSVQDTSSIATDPKFKDAANGVFSLQKDSPCRDTGTPVGLTQDFKGTAVPQGSQVDIGAFEIEVISGILSLPLV